MKIGPISAGFAVGGGGGGAAIYQRRLPPVLGVKGKGVSLVTATIAFIPVECIYSMNTYSGILTIPQGSEQSERASL